MVPRGSAWMRARTASLQNRCIDTEKPPWNARAAATSSTYPQPTCTSPAGRLHARFSGPGALPSTASTTSAMRSHSSPAANLTAGECAVTEPTARRVTIADVARASGMSRAAVSLILNDRPGTGLSEEAAARVRAAADRLGYRPDPAAQSLRLGRSKSIGFISDQVTLTRYATAMLRGALDEAQAHGRIVLMAETRGDPGILAQSVEAMLDRRVDGLMFGLMSARLIDVPAIPPDTPRVIVNGKTAGGDPSILPEERAAGYAVAAHLLRAGHRRIGVIGDLPHLMHDPRGSVTIPDRFAGIAAAFDEAGVRPERVTVSDWQPADGYHGVHRLLAKHPDLTAILACNDNVAFGVYQALMQLGRSVPDDMSVISFDDEELAEYQRPGLTTAQLPYEEMGRRGVRMLLGGLEPADELVPVHLIERESVRILR
jgi:LacI family transcriptional regulator